MRLNHHTTFPAVGHTASLDTRFLALFILPRFIHARTFHTLCPHAMPGHGLRLHTHLSLHHTFAVPAPHHTLRFTLHHTTPPTCLYTTRSLVPTFTVFAHILRSYTHTLDTLYCRLFVAVGSGCFRTLACHLSHTHGFHKFISLVAGWTSLRSRLHHAWTFCPTCLLLGWVIPFAHRFGFHYSYRPLPFHYEHTTCHYIWFLGPGSRVPSRLHTLFTLVPFHAHFTTLSFGWLQFTVQFSYAGHCLSRFTRTRYVAGLTFSSRLVTPRKHDTCCHARFGSHAGLHTYTAHSSVCTDFSTPRLGSRLVLQHTTHSRLRLHCRLCGSLVCDGSTHVPSLPYTRFTSHTHTFTFTYAPVLTHLRLYTFTYVYLTHHVHTFAGPHWFGLHVYTRTGHCHFHAHVHHTSVLSHVAFLRSPLHPRIGFAVRLRSTHVHAGLHAWLRTHTLCVLAACSAITTFSRSMPSLWVSFASPPVVHTFTTGSPFITDLHTRLFCSHWFALYRLRFLTTFTGYTHAAHATFTFAVLLHFSVCHTLHTH